MEFEIRSRRCGKTYEMIQRIKDDPWAILVVHREDEKRRLIKQYGNIMVDPEHQIETYQTILRGYYRPTLSRCTLYLDNVDLWLQSQFDAKIECVTATREDSDSEAFKE